MKQEDGLTNIINKTYSGFFTEYEIMERKEIALDKLAFLALECEEEKTNSYGEFLEVFDEEGKSIGVVPRLICHRLGLIHKVVYCIITNSVGQMLLQTRGDVKGGRYDIAVAGHLSIDDSSTEEAIRREIREEIGLEIIREKLTYITTYKRTKMASAKKPREINRELRSLFHYEFDDREQSSINKLFKERSDTDAVLNIGWHDLQEVIEACDKERVADGLYSSLMHYLLWKLDKQGAI